MGSTLYKRSIPINDYISIYVPTVGELFDNEDDYYDAVFTIIATPYDMMVQLDDAGIDFSKISNFELFCLLFPRLQKQDTSLIFGNLDLSRFVAAQSQDNGRVVLIDSETGHVIDEVLHSIIVTTLQQMLNIQNTNKKPGNDAAKKYMIERARKKLKRKSNKHNVSRIEEYVVALVNTAEFHYNYETIRDITIYQFYASLKQIIHKIQYDNMMHGYFSGTIKSESLKPEDRTWIIPLSQEV